MRNSSSPGSASILLCQGKEEEEGSGLDLHAQYIAKTDRNLFVFILWSFLLVLAELPLFYGMHSFTSQVFSVTKIPRPDRYFDLKVNHEVHFEQQIFGEKNQRTHHIFMPFLDSRRSRFSLCAIFRLFYLVEWLCASRDFDI